MEVTQIVPELMLKRWEIIEIILTRVHNKAPLGFSSIEMLYFIDYLPQ